MWKTHKRTIVLTLAAYAAFPYEENSEIYTVQAANSHGFAACFRFFPGESSDFLRESPFFVDFISVYMLQ